MERAFINREFIEKQPNLARLRGNPHYQELLAPQSKNQKEPPPAKPGEHPER